MPAYGYLFCILATAHAATFYVSTTGSDANAGTSPALAFRNPGRACSAIAVLRNPEGLLPSHVEVRILDGTYFLPGPLSIDAQCAGDGVHGVTWLADSGDVGRVRLSGGRPVGPWEPVPGYADVFSAVLSAAAYPQQFVRQLFAVDPQSGASTRRLLASTPVQQYANISYGARNATVTLPPGALGNATAAELSGAYVLLYHTWTTSVSPVTSWDPSTGVLSTSWTANTDFGSNSRYAVQNIADPGRLQPGTFFFDATSRVMTYRAAPGESVPAAMLVAPAMPEVLVCNASAAARALNVSFVNVSIVHAGAWLEEDCMVDGCSYQGAADSHLGAVHLHGAGSWTFQWVEVAHTGQYAVYVDDANDDVTLAGCYVHDTGMGGLRVGAATSGLLPDPAQLTAGVTVEDCTLADGGLLVAGGEGVMWQAAADGILEHNEIRDYSYTGVSVGWTWSYEATPVSGISVAYNHIYGIGNDVLSDLAGIYAVGPQPGGVFDHNLVHNVSCGGNGAHALYIDQACSGTRWTNNVAYGAESSVFHVNYGLNNSIINNVLTAGDYVPGPGAWPCSYAPDCLPVGLLSNKADPGHGEQSVSSFDFRRNIVLLMAPNVTTPFQTLAASGVKNCTFDLNVYWSAASGANLTFPPTQAPLSFAQWQAGGQDASSVVADPLFADPSASNFTLLPGSPALALGFEPIDVSTAGPRPARAYPALPPSVAVRSVL